MKMELPLFASVRLFLYCPQPSKLALRIFPLSVLPLLSRLKTLWPSQVSGCLPIARQRNDQRCAVGSMIGRFES